MLSSLHIQNFAIIEDIRLNFQPGLIILTGETGAGKSILVDALEAVVGGRADITSIRSGAEKAIIEAEFTFSNPSENPVTDILQREDLLDDPCQVILSREIRSNGRHIARVNGRMVNTTILREIGEELVDIHGQSEHLSLLRVSEHLRLLDNFAKAETLYRDYQQAYQTWLEIRRSLAALRQLEQESARRLDLLTYQLNEIQSAHLQLDEENELLTERTRLANAENLANGIQQALYLLDEEAPDNRPVLSQFGEIISHLNTLPRYDPQVLPLVDQANNLFDAISELVRNLRRYADTIEFNPKKLDQVEDRLNLIHILKRKYGNTIEAILKYADQVQSELMEITTATDKIETLLKQEQEALNKLRQAGLKLSEARHHSSEKLSRAVEKELQDLHMPKAQFQVQFQTIKSENEILLEEEKKISFNAHGFEQVEFLIAPNPGEGFKPLVKIASGGETSRLMLALKNVLTAADPIPCLVFDEIDQGIGGKVGITVGKKLRQLSHRHQVFCITHLPQLAAFGDQHFTVSKKISAARTITEVEEITSERRVTEIASMFGDINPSTIQSARELLHLVQDQDMETPA